MITKLVTRPRPPGRGPSPSRAFSGQASLTKESPQKGTFILSSHCGEPVFTPPVRPRPTGGLQADAMGTLNMGERATLAEPGLGRRGPAI
jgi:hypothetical protein